MRQDIKKKVLKTEMHTSGRIPLLIGLFSLMVVCSSAQIFLSQSGALEWSGDCYGCPMVAPCQLAAITIMTGTDKCNVTFNGEDWGTTIITIESSADLDILFGDDLTRLSLALNVSNSVHFIGNNRETTWASGKVTVVSNGGMVSLHLSNMSLGVVEFEFAQAPQIASIILEDLTVGLNGTGPLIKAPTTLPTQLSVLNSDINVEGYLIETAILGETSIVSSRVNASKTIRATARIEGTISVSHSEIGISEYFYGSPSINETAAKLELSDTTVFSLLANNVPFCPSANLYRLSTHFETVTLRSVNHTANGIAILSNVEAFNSHISIGAIAPTVPRLNRITTTSPSSIRLSTPSAILSDVSMGFSTPMTPTTNALWIGCDFNSGPDSRLDVQALWLGDGANITFDHLIVREALYSTSALCVTSGAPTWLIAKRYSDWRFQSIVARQISLDMGQLITFVYIVTDASAGILSIGRIETPNRVRIDWNVQTLGQPNCSISYPLFSASFPMRSPDIITNLTDYVIRVVNIANTISFQFAIPPQPVDSTTCATPFPQGFTCVNGQLVSVGDITGPTIEIPPNAGTVQVNGDLTTETIVFDGIGSTLNVSGCASIPGGITIQLKGKDKKVPEGPLVLVIQNEGCTSSLLDIPVRIEEEKSCKKTKITQDGSATKSSLVVLMNVDSSSCNTRWIILGSVLGGVALLTAIGAIAGKILYNKKMKTVPRGRPTTSY